MKHLPHPLARGPTRGCKPVAHMPYGSHRPVLLVPHNVFSFHWLSLYRIGILHNKHLFSLLFLNIRMLDILKAISANAISRIWAPAPPHISPPRRHMLQAAQPAPPPRHGQCLPSPRRRSCSLGLLWLAGEMQAAQFNLNFRSTVNNV